MDTETSVELVSVEQIELVHAKIWESSAEKIRENPPKAADTDKVDRGVTVTGGEPSISAAALDQNISGDLGSVDQNNSGDVPKVDDDNLDSTSNSDSDGRGSDKLAGRVGAQSPGELSDRVRDLETQVLTLKRQLFSSTLKVCNQVTYFICIIEKIIKNQRVYVLCIFSYI